jgi:outer membrane protein OmpA-like peptidoglycan-associated protein
MRKRLLGFAALGSFVCSTPLASAEPIRAHGELSVAKAVGGFQGSELSFGAAGYVAGEMPLVPQVGAEVELGTVLLAKGDETKNPALVPQDGANAIFGAVGLRANPFRKADPADISPLTGIWLASHVGATTTGGLFRGMFDVHVGYDVMVKEGRFGIGPALGFIHVFQPDSELRPEDANIFTLGVHGMFDSAPRLPKDRDGDGILDRNDRCPDDPEDKDGFEDEDGCPEADNDKDGILDSVDKCPLVPEDKDGFEDEDGCPEADNDKDGILDGVDKCPNEAEDKDGFEDEDGCPDPDNDKDGLPDKEDLCPLEPETVNEYADEDGCPDEEQVRVVGEHIILDDRVHFGENTSIIRPTSYPLLERLAQLLRNHPEYIHIEVQGHTDQRGPQDFNERLGKDRAGSVADFLVKQGIDKDRLSSIGFAATRVLSNERTEHALFMNRRVEFLITRNVEHGGTGTNNTNANPQKMAPGGAMPTPQGTAPPAGTPPSPEPVEKVPGTGLTDTEVQ